MAKPITIIISGPSGVGKGTICARLKEVYPYEVGISVSSTTRNPRPGEINGVHYDFITKEEFEARLENDYYAEYNKTSGGDYYGTPRKEIDRVMQEGKDLILEIEVNGGNQIIDKELADLTIFITSPIEVIEARLRGRNTETEEQIQKRLATARFELENHGKYQYEIENKDGMQDECVQQIIDLIYKKKGIQ